MSVDAWQDRLPVHAAEAAAAYRAAGGWTDDTTVQRFRAIARAFPHREAVVGPDATYTYAQLDMRSDQIAAALHARGLQAGDPVLLQIGNSAEGVLALYSLFKAGAVPVATLASHREHEILHIGRMVGATAHVVDAAASDGFLVPFAKDCAATSPTVRLLLCVGADAAGFTRLGSAGTELDAQQARAVVDGIQSAISPESVAVFQLSGGTTGTPKVIPRLHVEYWNNALTNSVALQRDETARVAHAMPFIHNAGMVHAIFGAHAVGGCAVVLPFGPAERSLQFLTESGVNDMMIAGPMAPWVDHPLWEKFAANLSTVIFSGSKAPEPLYERVASFGTWIGQVWGMAEGPYTTTSRGTSDAIRRDTVGWPNFTQDSFKIVDAADGRELPDGQTGLLLYRGPSTLAGYFDAPEHNAVAIRAGGYFDTGDLAKVVRIDGQRCLSIEGRMKDVISRGGEKISTEEVEKLLLKHESIVQAAVVAMPDKRLGERACAYISLADGVSTLPLEEVQQHFASLGVAKFKWPERLEIVPALPRTNTLKIDKKRLRAQIAQIVADDE